MAQALNPHLPASAPRSSPSVRPRPSSSASWCAVPSASSRPRCSPTCRCIAASAYDEQAVDRSLKTLFATGLFADVKFNWNGSTLTVNVVENPIINQVVFEGNDKVSEKDLKKEVQLKPRTVFTRNKVQADVQRIIELYRRNGKFAATVDPQIIQRPQNRVDLIFSIHEGPTTGVARISFIGNKVFDDSTLRRSDRDRGKRMVEIPRDQRQLRSRPADLRPRAASPLLPEARLCGLRGEVRRRRADARTVRTSTSPSRSTKASSIISARSRSIPRSRS